MSVKRYLQKGYVPGQRNSKVMVNTIKKITRRFGSGVIVMCPGYERQTWAVLELLIISGGLEEKQKESDRNANLGSHLANKRIRCTGA